LGRVLFASYLISITQTLLLRKKLQPFKNEEDADDDIENGDVDDEDDENKDSFSLFYDNAVKRLSKN
jgi:hypothetical protein